MLEGRLNNPELGLHEVLGPIDHAIFCTHSMTELHNAVAAIRNFWFINREAPSVNFLPCYPMVNGSGMCTGVFIYQRRGQYTGLHGLLVVYT